MLDLDKKTTLRLMLLLAFGVILAWMVNSLDQISRAISWFINLIDPLLTGFCFAFVLNILLRPLELLWDRALKKVKSPIKDKLRRPVCLTGSLLLLLGFISIFFLVLVPQIVMTVQSIAVVAPQAPEKIQLWWENVSRFLENFGTVVPDLNDRISQITSSAINYLTQWASTAVSKAMGVTVSFFTVLFNLLLALIFSVYMLGRKEQHGLHARRAVRAILPQRTADRVLDIVSLAGRCFGNYVTGQLTEAVILGCLCFIGMLIFRFPYAPVVSVVVAFTALVPIFGAWIGAVVGAFLIVFVDPMKALLFLVYLIVLQQLEGNIIYPRVVGRSVGLPGLWVLAAVTIGGSAFGIVGMLIGVPMMAVVYTLLGEFIGKRTAQIPDEKL